MFVGKTLTTSNFLQENRYTLYNILMTSSAKNLFDTFNQDIQIITGELTKRNYPLAHI